MASSPSSRAPLQQRSTNIQNDAASQNFSSSLLGKKGSSSSGSGRPKHTSFCFKMVMVVILLALPRVFIQNLQNLDTDTVSETVQSNVNRNRTSKADDDGYWVPSEEFPPPYNFSQQICNKTCIHQDDCIKANYCSSDLMNWVYIKDGKPTPRFNATDFVQKMKNKRILFMGCSLMRQQLLALVWTLGNDSVAWKRDKPESKNCTADSHCFTDEKHNITFCHQFLGSIATKVYHEGNYTLDHSLRGKGDSSCLLEDSYMAKIRSSDLVFVQSLAWWTNLGTILDSPTSPKDWVDKMLPAVYYDAMKELLTKISEKAETIFVLGHIGVNCKEKTLPEPFMVDNIPPNNGWNLVPKFWDTSLHLLLKERLDIKVVDARDPLMQSVHSHPSSGYAYPGQPYDCLHFCMNSAAVNMYLDLYWNEVFSEIST